jgi:GntR family transcriptional repressor for pyruvate dehydrogenase complex
MTRTTPGASRVREIADTLRRQILSGKYEPGERLPSERDLADKTGANRTSVREALKELEHAGMIRIRRGDGARVLPLEETGLGVLQHLLRAKPGDRELLAQWLDVWELVLTGAARLAIERGTDEEQAEALRLVRKLRTENLGLKGFVEVSDALTDLIAVASRNVVLRMVRNGLTAQIQAARGADLRYVLRPPPEVLDALLRAAEVAIEKRDALAVSETLRSLMRMSREATLDAVTGSAVKG